MSYPQSIRIYLRHQAKSGLFAAVSDDLPGLMTVADSIEEIRRRLPSAIQQLIKAQFDENVSVALRDDEGDDDFISLREPKVAELRAA